MDQSQLEQMTPEDRADYHFWATGMAVKALYEMTSQAVIRGVGQGTLFDPTGDDQRLMALAREAQRAHETAHNAKQNGDYRLVERCYHTARKSLEDAVASI